MAVKESKIVIVGDISRIESHPFNPEEPFPIYNQKQNTQQIAALVRWPIENVFGQAPSVCLGDPEDPYILAIARSALVEMEHTAYLGMAQQDWANRYCGIFSRNYEVVDDRLMGPLARYLPNAALVLGFELSPGIRRWLDERDVSYINISLDPRRFLPDLLLLATSNRPELIEAMRAFQVEEYAVQSAVDSINALGARYKPDMPWLPKGTILVAGQTGMDQTVIRDSRFVSLADYHESIIAEAEVAPFTLILPHPFADAGWQAEEKLLRSIGSRAMVIARNAYALLADERISRVVTIGSGLGCEATYFGKSVRFLLEDPMKRFTRGTAGSVSLPANSIRQPAFWLIIAEAMGLAATNPSPVGLVPTSLSFRDIIGVGWAYPGLIDKTVGPNPRRLVNFDAIQGSAESIVRKAFELAIDCSHLKRIDIEYHAGVVKHSGKNLFFESLLASEAARQRGVVALQPT